MASASGIPIDSYRKYELGRSVPGGNALAGLAGIGVDVHWLLTGKVKPGQLATEQERTAYFRSDAALQTALRDAPNPDAAVQAMQRVRDASDVIQRLKAECEYEPPAEWGATLLQLLAGGDITERGARRVIEELRGFEAEKSSSSEGGA